MEQLAALILVILALTILGMIVAFSPTLVVTEVTVLLKSKNPFWHTVALISGISVAIVIFSIVATVVTDPSQSISIPHRERSIKTLPFIDFILGSALIFLGVKYLNRPKRIKHNPRFKPENLLSTKTLFWFGLVKMFTSISSIFAIILAARIVKSSLGHSATQFVAISWLIVVSLLPFILIAAAKVYRPELFMLLQENYKRLAPKNLRKFVCILAIFAGVLLIASAIF